jgi:hypothetical protein
MHTFDTPEPISVVLELRAGAVHLVASNRTDTVVEVRPSNASKKSDVAAAQETTVDFADGTLRVKSPRGWRHWTPWSNNESVDVHIDVPVGSRVRSSAGAAALRCRGRVGECDVKSGAGDTRIEDAGSVAIAIGSGDVDVESSAGHLEVKAARGSVRIGTVDGSAVIKNSSGDTSVNEISGDLRVNAANGDVVVNRAHATVAVKTANGNVRIDEVERGQIVAETARGTVEVGIRSGVAAWLDLNTAFGRVRNDLDAAGPPASGEDAVDVRARTAYGDINIRRAVTDE